jgi:hypothetical protein
MYGRRKQLPVLEYLKGDEALRVQKLGRRVGNRSGNVPAAPFTRRENPTLRESTKSGNSEIFGQAR